MDSHTPEQRSYNMSRVKGKNTKPEVFIRKLIWKNGYRYRLHRNDLPGTPDLVFPKYKAVIFIHGCFRHKHSCKKGKTPKTRREFWSEKLSNNKRRDKKSITQLIHMGWRVMVIWECEITNNSVESILSSIIKFLEKSR